MQLELLKFRRINPEDAKEYKDALNEMLAKLKKANISTNNLGIPVIDKYGELFSNNTTFDDFIKKLIP